MWPRSESHDSAQVNTDFSLKKKIFSYQDVVKPVVPNTKFINL